MSEEWGETLGRSESQLDAPRGAWGSILSQRNEPRLNPSEDLGKFAKESDAQGKAADVAMRKKGMDGKLIVFTEPVKNEAGMMSPISKGKFPRQEEPATGGSSVDHDWKVTISAAAEDNEPAWEVAAGNVHYINESVSAVIPVTSVLGETGTIYLHLTRDPASRSVTLAEVEFYVEAPIATETDQFIELAYVGGAPSIVQKQFTPIRVYEDLFVINGAFKLGGLAFFGDNLYDPPI